MGKLVVTIGVGDQQGRQFEDLEVTVDTGSTFTAVPSTGTTAVPSAMTFIPCAGTLETGPESPVRVGVYPQAFVEKHNLAVLSCSARIAGRSKATIERLLATLPGSRKGSWRR